MPMYKYRPNKQWGKMNTRIFKEIYARQVQKHMPEFTMPQLLLDRNEKIYDPNDADFPNSVFPKPSPPVDMHPAHYIPRDEDHIDYQPTPAQMFDGQEPLAAGLDQALQLTKTVLRKGLPSSVYTPGANLMAQGQASSLITNAIMHAHAYDGITERLPIRRHADLWWTNDAYPEVEGVSRQRANKTVIRNLIRACIALGVQKSKTDDSFIPIAERLRTLRVTDNANVSTTFDVGDPRGHPLAFFYDTTLTILSPMFVPDAADTDTVQSTSAEKIVNVKPIHPYIDARETNVYKAESYYPGFTHDTRPDARRLYVHTVIGEHTPDQFYPRSAMEIKAQAFLQAFAAAGALAKRRGNVPVTVQSISLSEGVLDMCVVQLNTTALTHEFKSGANDEGVKNICWFDSEPLYEAHPMWEEFTEVTNLNPVAIDKFASLIYNCHKVKSSKTKSA